MRGNTENSTLLAISYEKDKLIDWYNSQLATEVYEEVGSPSFEVHGDSHRWHKAFKTGSPLEWYNPCYNFEPNHFGQGISEEWTNEEAIRNCGILLIN